MGATAPDPFEAGLADWISPGGWPACLAWDLGTPGSYADAFRRLQAAGFLEEALEDRFVRAAGFRNIVAHA